MLVVLIHLMGRSAIKLPYGLVVRTLGEFAKRRHWIGAED